VSHALNWKIKDSLYISFASDFFINTLDANLYQYAKPTRYSSLSVLVFQYLRPRWEVNGNILATLVREKTMEGQPAPDRNILTPSVSCGYRLTQSPNIRLRFLYKDVFRMPTFNDLYYTLVGNNNLKPEYAKQYNAGVTAFSHWGIIEYISCKADFFYNHVKDKIVAVPTKNLFVWSMRNIGLVDIKGMELQAQLQTKPILGLRYSITCNYTYQEATDVTDKNSATYNQQIPYIPFETFTAMGTVAYKSLSLSYNTLFNGYRYVLGENIYENMIPSWWTSDISALYNLKIKDSTVKMKGEVNNVFDKQYEVIRSFPMPGRSYTVALTLLF
jgi:outer membrane cobalamin receptor